MAIGPALGGFITTSFSLNYLFYTSSFFALLSIVILVNLKETHLAKQRFRPGLLRISRHEIFEPAVLPAAFVTVTGYFSYGVILTLIPDWSGHLGVSNKGLFFVVFTLASLLVRFGAGRLSDRKGRIIVLKWAFVLLILSLLLIGGANNAWTLLTGGFLYGIATGLFSPASTAFTIDLSHPDRRGRAMATMYMALEVGIGGGALLAGSLFADRYHLVPALFWGTAGVTAIGLVYLWMTGKKDRTAKSINA
jgi:MFS family permease